MQDLWKEKYWETAGVLAGVIGCSALVMQIIHELHSSAESSLSIFHLFGFWIIYIFWTFYGIHFKRTAVWLTNSVAALLQTILVIICL